LRLASLLTHLFRLLVTVCILSLITCLMVRLRLWQKSHQTHDFNGTVEAVWIGNLQAVRRVSCRIRILRIVVVLYVRDDFYLCGKMRFLTILVSFRMYKAYGTTVSRSMLNLLCPKCNKFNLCHAGLWLTLRSRRSPVEKQRCRE